MWRTQRGREEAKGWVVRRFHQPGLFIGVSLLGLPVCLQQEVFLSPFTDDETVARKSHTLGCGMQLVCHHTVLSDFLSLHVLFLCMCVCWGWGAYTQMCSHEPVPTEARFLQLVSSLIVLIVLFEARSLPEPGAPSWDKLTGQDDPQDLPGFPHGASSARPTDACCHTWLLHRYQGCECQSSHLTRWAISPDLFCVVLSRLSCSIAQADLKPTSLPLPPED